MERKRKLFFGIASLLCTANSLFARNEMQKWAVGVHGGVDAARLTAVGYGETKPIADNETAEGRAQNR